MSFSDFEFDPSLDEALSAMGFESPTPVQQLAIPTILANDDLIACAQTGTGKTAAFLLPILHKLASNPDRGMDINTLVIAPTRELALQIDQQVEGFGYFTGVSSLPVYGGGSSSSWDQQKKALKSGADIIIATPGRLIAHINLGYVNLKNVQHLILDEADRMLDMGFYDDIMSIVRRLPKDRQNLLFSATMPAKIRTLANAILKNPKQINIAISKPAEGVLQGAYMTYDNQKIPLIEHLLTGKKNYPSVLIFSSTRRMVKEIAEMLHKKKFSTGVISSDLEQKEREAALLNFRNKKTQILVATDILARGIDIKEISLIINYDVPQDAEDYVHRIGRTARADTTGVALTFITQKDQHRFASIERLIEQEVRKIPLPKHLGEGPEYNPKARKPRGYRGGNRNRKRGGGKSRTGGGQKRRGGNKSGGNKRNNSSSKK
ncbi:MAG: DEAD/DEAH box helicase [Bacteroidota bacterium]